MGVRIKEFFRLVEDFVNMIGMQMSGFQDIYEVTENLGEPLISSVSCSLLSSSQDDLFFLQTGECVNLDLQN